MVKILGTEYDVEYPRTKETIAKVQEVLSKIDTVECADFFSCFTCPFSLGAGNCIVVSLGKEKGYSLLNEDGKYKELKYKELKIKIFKEYIGEVYKQEELDV